MPSSEKWQMTKIRITGMAFAVIVGYVDIITYVRFKAFCATMTGNTVLLVRSLYITFVEPNPSEAQRSLITNDPWTNYVEIILSFFSGVFIYWIMEFKYPKRAGSILGPIVAIGATGGGITYVLLHGESYAIRSRATILMSAVVFGMVNSMASLGGAGSVTAITGHLVKITKGLVGICTKGFNFKDFWAITISLSVYVGLVIGCALGICMTTPFFQERKIPILLPVYPLVGLLMWYHEHLRQGYRLLKGWRKRKGGRGDAEEEAEEDDLESDDDAVSSPSSMSDDDISDLPSGHLESSDVEERR